MAEFNIVNGHFTGKLNFNGNDYAFGSGISAESPHIPWGDWIVTPNEMGSWGVQHHAIGINHNSIPDPALGRTRLGIEFHAGHLPHLFSHGCIAITPNEYSEFRESLLKYVSEKGNVFLHVHPEGACINDSLENPFKVIQPIVSNTVTETPKDKGVLLYLPGMWSRYYGIKPEVVEGYVKEYATLKGYSFDHINISGDYRTLQYHKALERIQKGDVTAVFGFSAGGYTINSLLPNLSKTLRDKIQLEVIVGSPGVNAYPGIKEHVIMLNPPEGHLHGPEVLLRKTKAELNK